MRVLVLLLAAGLAEGETLRAAAKGRLFMGASIREDHLSSDADYASVAAKQYDLVTPGNACKWHKIRAEGEDSYNFTACDHVKNYTLHTVKGAFRGHNLCWGIYNPSWVDALPASQKSGVLIEHITKVVRRYGDEVYGWDVVNEAMATQGGFKNNTWYPDVPDYVDVAFTAARAANSKTKLFYNDYAHGYGTGKQKTKADAIYAMVKGMKDRGVPIDGVGFQMHIKGENEPDYSGLAANIARYQDIGIEVHITELDITFSTWNSTAEARQAQIYGGLLSVCLKHPACKNFETWGYTDLYTWKGTAAHPLPFDVDLKPKDAVGKMLSVLATQGTADLKPKDA
eukprot:Hpha_TRINITY_DN19070_c0_g1::TRINITY_DN19070_c0_g1_i1::g.138323::m.138323/K01181/E3.2.1.8, xynA; endo-1,4-beta-xylanase